MAKLTKRLIEEIALFIEQDNYTVSEVCTMFGISRKTFYEWKATKPQFASAIEEAERNRNEMLLTLARKGLRERLNGYTVYTEKVVFAADDEVDGGYRVVKKECVTKEYGPDLKAIKYVLEREAKMQEKQGSEQPEEKDLPKEEIILTPEEQKKKDLYEKYGDIMNLEDTAARHQVMFLKDKMKDGTHPQLTGKRQDPNWELEYIGM